jgi:hypothetical protein
MHRHYFVAIMAVLLVAGMVSSSACEMTCIPTVQTAVCCGQQMRQSQPFMTHAAVHSINHCRNEQLASLTGAHQCGHPQENAAVLTIATQAIQPHATENISTALTALPDHNSIALGPDTFSLTGLNRSSFLAPLRI